MHGSSLRRRVETYSAASFVAGLAWWYLGGSSAITGMLVATPVILGGIAFGCVVALALTVALRRDGLRRAAGDGFFAGAGTALMLASAVPWLNQHLDGASGHEVAFTVRAVRQPTKGPRSLDVTIGDQPTELPYADGCTKGSTGVVTQHAGAFGFAWTTTPRCPPAPP